MTTNLDTWPAGSTSHKLGQVQRSKFNVNVAKVLVVTSNKVLLVTNVLVKGQKFKIEVLLNILGRSWQVVSKYSFGSPES